MLQSHERESSISHRDAIDRLDFLAHITTLIIGQFYGSRGRGRDGLENVGFFVAKALQETPRFVSRRRLEAEIRLLAPRGIGDVKKCLAYGLESVIVFDVKRNPELAIFQVSLQELITIAVPVQSLQGLTAVAL